jgi:arylsulfatase A-like enzyme
VTFPMRILPFLLLGLVPLAAAEPAAPRRPNILFIVSDDQAWTDYGFTGAKVVRTPNLDRLARDSVAFPRGYVVNSLCGPSLASLLTGVHPHRHGMTGNDPALPDSAGKGAQRYQSAEFRAGRARLTELWERQPHLPRLLSEAGYRTMQTGKWWLGDYTHGGFQEGMTKGGRHGDEGLVIGRKTLAPATDFMAKAKQEGKPFFVWYAPMMPHDPHTPPERLLEKYRPLTPSLHQARYWAMVEWFDETVGELRAFLEKEGLAQDTLIVYLADNGWIQSLDNPRYAPRSKQSPYEGGVRTPILLSWPGRLAPTSVATPVSEVDILPTVLRLAGLAVPAGLDGIDLLDAPAVAARPAIFGSNSTHDIKEIGAPAKSLRYRWVVAGDWKLIVSSGLNDATEPPQLFHLKDDPAELRDLAPTEPARVAELRRRLDGWWDGR